MACSWPQDTWKSLKCISLRDGDLKGYIMYVPDWLSTMWGKFFLPLSFIISLEGSSPVLFLVWVWIFSCTVCSLLWDFLKSRCSCLEIYATFWLLFSLNLSYPIMKTDHSRPFFSLFHSHLHFSAKAFLLVNLSLKVMFGWSNFNC